MQFSVGNVAFVEAFWNLIIAGDGDNEKVVVRYRSCWSAVSPKMSCSWQVLLIRGVGEIVLASQYER